MLQTMPAIRGLDTIGEKWSTNAGNAQSYYEQGVRNPRSSWSRGAQAAEPTYKAAVIEAANAGRYGKGVSAAGDSSWQNGALNVGAGRYPGGVQAAKDKYAQRFGKYASVIQSTQLAPRGPKGSPANENRSLAMQRALHKAKVGA